MVTRAAQVTWVSLRLQAARDDLPAVVDQLGPGLTDVNPAGDAGVSAPWVPRLEVGADIGGSTRRSSRVFTGSAVAGLKGRAFVTGGMGACFSSESTSSTSVWTESAPRITVGTSAPPRSTPFLANPAA